VRAHDKEGEKGFQRFLWREEGFSPEVKRPWVPLVLAAYAWSVEEIATEGPSARVGCAGEEEDGARGGGISSWLLWTGFEKTLQ